MRVTVQKTRDHITMIAGNPDGTFVAVGAKTRVWQSDPWAWIATGEDRAELSSLPRTLAILWVGEEGSFERHEKTGELLWGCPTPKMKAAWDDAYLALDNSTKHTKRTTQA